jgi:hypothetical protein
MRPPASLRLSIASSRTVSSSAMEKVYGQAASSDHPLIASSRASSPTRVERSRAVSLVTSLGSCGPTYEPPSMRRHHDRGSDDFRGLSSRAEGVSLPIGSVSVSRSAAPRRRCGRGSWEGSFGAFLEPSFVGLSPPSSAPGCAVSAPARAPSDARGYPCSARALRGYANAPSYSPNILCPQGLCEVLCGCAYCCRCSSQISFSSSRPGSVILNTAP